MDQSVKDRKREGAEQGNPPREATQTASFGMSGAGGPCSGGEKLAISLRICIHRAHFANGQVHSP